MMTLSKRLARAEEALAGLEEDRRRAHNRALARLLHGLTVEELEELADHDGEPDPELVAYLEGLRDDDLVRTYWGELEIPEKFKDPEPEPDPDWLEERAREILPAEEFELLYGEV